MNPAPEAPGPFAQEAPGPASPAGLAPSSAEASPQARGRWLAVLAQAPRAGLAGHAGRLQGESFVRLREPEVGLALIRARISNSGDRFNLGDATVTRCVVRHRADDGRLAAGVGYVLGRDPERAEWIACFDALLQQPGHQERLLREVVEPLAQALAAGHAADAAQAAASRVDFRTLAPENPA